jgi:hypothetical protein
MASSTTVAEELELYEEAVAAARERREEIVRERSAAHRAVGAAEGARLALEERRGAGEEVSEEEIAEAVAAIEEAREAADQRVWNARIEGADRAIQEAEATLRRFGREHFAELAAEEVLLDDPAREALQEAWAAFDAAASAYALRTRRWHKLAEFGGIDPRDIPSNPVRGDEVHVRQRFAAGIETPTPRSLRGG